MYTISFKGETAPWHKGVDFQICIKVLYHFLGKDTTIKKAMDLGYQIVRVK